MKTIHGYLNITWKGLVPITIHQDKKGGRFYTFRRDFKVNVTYEGKALDGKKIFRVSKRSDIRRLNL